VLLDEIEERLRRGRDLRVTAFGAWRYFARALAEAEDHPRVDQVIERVAPRWAEHLHAGGL